MSGDELKLILANNGWTGRALADALGKNERTVYEWFAKPVIKVQLLKTISEVTGIDELSDNQAKETADNYGKRKVYHHGRNVMEALKKRDMRKQGFAVKMGWSRPTLDARLTEKEWDAGELMKAAEILNMPVAQLKGLGSDNKAFERDIYQTLAIMAATLKRIEAKLG